MESKRLNDLRVYEVGWSSKFEESGESMEQLLEGKGMGAKKRTERFQGRAESQAVAGAHKYVKKSVSTMLCSRTQQPSEENEHGSSFGERKDGCGKKR